MPSIVDDEFGTITVRRSASARQVRIRVAPNGTLRASMPPYTPMLFLKRLIKSSREELRGIIRAATPQVQYKSGQLIGKRHTLLIQKGSASSVSRDGTKIIVTLKPGDEITDAAIAKELRATVITALRSEAREYLSRRLERLAHGMDAQYERVRFSHASSRWGSCSSTGTISLNIALMKLPHALIDYVIIHELAHTKQMNHSKDFWDIVQRYDGNYKLHRKALANETPSI